MNINISEEQAKAFAKMLTCLILSDAGMCADEQNAEVQDGRNGAPVQEVVEAKHVH